MLSNNGGTAIDISLNINATFLMEKGGGARGHPKVNERYSYLLGPPFLLLMVTLNMHLLHISVNIKKSCTKIE